MNTLTGYLQVSIGTGMQGTRVYFAVHQKAVGRVFNLPVRRHLREAPVAVRLRECVVHLCALRTGPASECAKGRRSNIILVPATYGSPVCCQIAWCNLAEP